MKRPLLNRRTLALSAILLPLLALFAYAAVRSGPLASVPVTTALVENRAITPALYGIGTIEARYTHKIGPTIAGRVKDVYVQVGDRVSAGQLLGEMDPVDFDERLAAQDSAQKRAAAGILGAEAQLQESMARRAYAESQRRRYQNLMQAGSTSMEALDIKTQELEVADANLATARANLEIARHEVTRLAAEREVLERQRNNLRLLAPADGLVTARLADSGTTLVAGQPVVEMIDPKTIWIHARFEQLNARGLQADLPARITLRSHGSHPVAGHVLRVEPIADTVTEEILAKISFDIMPEPMPPIGELTEVTVALPALPAASVVPNASIQRVGDRPGVWIPNGSGVRFVPIRIGTSDLEGRVQVLEGLEPGMRVAVHSTRALRRHSRVKLVERLPGIQP